MRTVTVTAPGKVELSTMWLPGFIAFDTRFQQELEKTLAPKFVGRALTEDVLDELHAAVVECIQARYNIKGLRDLLDALKFVEGPVDG